MHETPAESNFVQHEMRNRWGSQNHLASCETTAPMPYGEASHARMSSSEEEARNAFA